MFTKLYVYLYTHIHIKEYVVMIYSWNDSPNLPYYSKFLSMNIFCDFCELHRNHKIFVKKISLQYRDPRLETSKIME